MKVVKIIPFALLPLVVVGYKLTNKADDLDNSVILASQKVSKGNTVALKNPTEEELKALDYMEAFLKKYTSNGKLNYGTIYRLQEGLKLDYKTVNEEGKSMSGFKGMAARAYPNNLLKSTYYKVQKEIERRTRTEMSSDFTDFGVDPQTEEKVDDALIENYVTKPELLEYRKSSYIFKRIIEQDLPPGKKIAFKEGVSLDAIKFVRVGKKGLPPGVEMVDIPVIIEDKKDNTKKASGSM